MSRYKAGPGDKAYFSRTAVKTKKINLQPKIMRGGTRF